MDWWSNGGRKNNPLHTASPFDKGEFILVFLLPSHEWLGYQVLAGMQCIAQNDLENIWIILPKYLTLRTKNERLRKE